MMRTGSIGRRGRVVYEPITGLAIRLKCRGQLVESTPRVTYDVTIRERGYRPEPYAIADALVIVDGKPIVELIDISLQLSGTNQLELEALWSTSQQESAAARPMGSGPIFFDHDRILAFALGRPVEAFGESVPSVRERPLPARLRHLPSSACTGSRAPTRGPG